MSYNHRYNAEWKWCKERLDSQWTRNGVPPSSRDGKQLYGHGEGPLISMAYGWGTEIHAESDGSYSAWIAPQFSGAYTLQKLITYFRNGDVIVDVPDSVDKYGLRYTNSFIPRYLPDLVKRSGRLYWDKVLSTDEPKMIQCGYCHGAWKPEREAYRMFQTAPINCKCATYGAFRMSYDEVTGNYISDLDKQEWKPAGYRGNYPHLREEVKARNREYNATLAFPEGWTEDNPRMCTGRVKRAGARHFLPFISGATITHDDDGEWSIPGEEQDPQPTEVENPYVDDKGVFKLP